MRFLLLIPILVLFLSNVPFTQEMPMEKMMAIMEKQEEKDCCKKNAKQVEEMACHTLDEAQPGPGPMKCKKDQPPLEGACQPSGSNCVCICVFQYAGANDIKLFQFNPIHILAGHTGYLQVKWKDPHIASPGQPPDWI